MSEEQSKGPENNADPAPVDRVVMRFPQRFKYRKPLCSGFDFGVCYPMGKRWRVDVGFGHGTFDTDPWESLGQILGEVEEFAWIDNDHNWKA
jgi:hypothetical protein